jgi:hypothetical protein
MILRHDATIVFVDREGLRVFHGRDDASCVERAGPSAGGPALAALYLNDQVLGGRIGTLVIVAPPDTLAEMRRHYNAELKSRLIGEFATSIINASQADYAKRTA